MKTKISLKPYDYAPNHFWLDTAYRNFYDRYYANQPPAATPDMAPWNMTDIEVYEQVKDGSIPSQFKAIAYADLPPVGPSGRYDAAFRQLSANTVSGEVQPASFIKLEQGRHFEYDRQLGTLTIKTLQRDKIYAVAFKTSGRGTYGEFSNTRGDSTEVGVLRLIYVSNLQPGFKTLAENATTIVNRHGDSVVVIAVHAGTQFAPPVPPNYPEDFRTPAGTDWDNF